MGGRKDHNMVDHKEIEERVRKAQKNAGKILDRISKSRTKLVARLPFFGHLALKLRPRICTILDGVPTAAVASDGTLVVNAEFADKLNDPQAALENVTPMRFASKKRLISD